MNIPGFEVDSEDAIRDPLGHIIICIAFRLAVTEWDIRETYIHLNYEGWLCDDAELPDGMPTDVDEVFRSVLDGGIFAFGTAEFHVVSVRVYYPQWFDCLETALMSSEYAETHDCAEDLGLFLVAARHLEHNPLQR